MTRYWLAIILGGLLLYRLGYFLGCLRGYRQRMEEEDEV